jgi:Flp pilus assembly protein TadG
MATLELAAALPVLVVLLGVAVSVVSIGSQRVRAQDAASEVARIAARELAGQDASSQLERVAHEVAPGASIQVVRTGSDVVVTVRVRVHVLVDWLPAVTVSERAVAEIEPATGGP